MTNDLYLVLGVLAGLLAIPSLLSAFSESRPPRTAAILVMISGTLLALAVTRQPGGYAVKDIPDVFVRVIADFKS